MNRYRIVFTLFALMCFVYMMGVNYSSFHEVTLDSDGTYDIDLDFDGLNERIVADEYSNIVIYKIDKDGNQTDVTNNLPYSMIRIHRCCEAHRAYTTINYSLHTIYSEAHYGCNDSEIKHFKKVGNEWRDVLPIIPFSIRNKDLFPQKHIVQRYYEKTCYWAWGDGLGGFRYLIV